VADERQLWERQKGETQKSYAAFCLYRDAGPKRSLRATHDTFYGEGRSNLAQITVWSTKWQWVARTAAYDEHLDAQRRERMEAARAEIEDAELKDYRAQMKRWHEVWEQSPKFQQKARQFVKGQNGEPDREIVTIKLEIGDWRDMTRWRSEIANQGRRAVGLPEKILKDNVTYDGEQVITIKHENANGNTAKPLPAPGKHSVVASPVPDSGNGAALRENDAGDVHHNPNGA